MSKPKKPTTTTTPKPAATKPRPFARVVKSRDLPNARVIGPYLDRFAIITTCSPMQVMGYQIHACHARRVANNINAAFEAAHAERCAACPKVNRLIELYNAAMNGRQVLKPITAESAGLGEVDEDAPKKPYVCVICAKRFATYEALVRTHTPCPEVTKPGWDRQFHGIAELVAQKKPAPKRARKHRLIEVSPGKVRLREKPATKRAGRKP